MCGGLPELLCFLRENSSIGRALHVTWQGRPASHALCGGMRPNNTNKVGGAPAIIDKPCGANCTAGIRLASKQIGLARIIDSGRAIFLRRMA
jgi:hypothetical protein